MGKHGSNLDLQLAGAAETTPGTTGRREREESVVILGFVGMLFLKSVLVLPRS